MVYAIASRSAAGQYSIALTLSTIVAYASHAIIYGGFPRLTTLQSGEGLVLTGQMFRIGALLAALGGVVLGLASPFIVPVAFGSSYRASIVPTVLLIPGAVLYSGQYLLARAAAAEGDPRLLVRSFAVNLAVMFGLDAVAIPLAGINGAAVASAIGSAVGLAMCLRFYGRIVGSSVGLRRLFAPRRADLLQILRLPKTLVSSWRTRTRPPASAS